MRKQIISLGLIATLSTSLFAYTYEIKEGWQLMGAVQEIKDLSVFNDTCVDYLWGYDTNETDDTSKWRLHIANGVDYNYCGDVLTSLDKSDGFWVKASSDCNVTVDVCGTCDTDGTVNNANLTINGEIILYEKIEDNYNTNVSASKLKSIPLGDPGEMSNVIIETFE